MKFDPDLGWIMTMEATDTHAEIEYSNTREGQVSLLFDYTELVTHVANYWNCKVLADLDGQVEVVEKFDRLMRDTQEEVILLRAKILSSMTRGM